MDEDIHSLIKKDLNFVEDIKYKYTILVLILFDNISSI
jgi:hypothetical protein